LQTAVFQRCQASAVCNQRLADKGLDGIRRHVPNHEALGSSTDFRWPLVHRLRWLHEWRFVNVASLRIGRACCA
jgi:hypothetical protein